MARRGCEENGMRMITACFARALQKCTGRPYMGFLFIFQVVSPTDKTCNQLYLYPRVKHRPRCYACHIFSLPQREFFPGTPSLRAETSTPGHAGDDTSTVSEAAFRATFETHVFGSCTRSLRLNTLGSPVDRLRGKKAETRGLAWLPSSSLASGDAPDANRADAPRLLRPPPLAAFHHVCSQTRGLRPRWHAEEQDFSHAPDMVRQSCRHGRRTRPPLFGGARPVGR